MSKKSDAFQGDIKLLLMQQYPDDSLTDRKWVLDQIIDICKQNGLKFTEELS